MSKVRRIVVVDTNVVYLEPQLNQVPELTFDETTCFLIPATVLWELDDLKQRPQTRQRARAALNVLKAQIERGACEGRVSYGKKATLEIAGVDGTIDHPALAPDVPDDRILATCLAVANDAEEVMLATADFGLYAKARALKISGIYLERLEDAVEPSTRRERDEFAQKWRRLEASQDTWSVCRLGLYFVASKLVARVCKPVRESRDPPSVAAVLERWDELGSRWTQDVLLDKVFQSIFGVAHLAPVNYNVLTVTEPGKAPGVNVDWRETLPVTRSETPEEHVLRIRRDEEARRRREDYLVDALISQLEIVKEYVLDRTEADVGLGN